MSHFGKRYVVSEDPAHVVLFRVYDRGLEATAHVRETPMDELSEYDAEDCAYEMNMLEAENGEQD